MIHRLSATVAGRTHEISVEPMEGGRFRVTLDGQARVVDARRAEGGPWSILPAEGGPALTVDVEGTAPDFTVTLGGQPIPVKLTDARAALGARVNAAREHSGPQPVRAPMPGKVIKILARPGEEVQANQGVLVVEAMKMENELRTPRAGRIVEVLVREGQAVESGQTLATVG